MKETQVHLKHTTSKCFDKYFVGVCNQTTEKDEYYNLTHTLMKSSYTLK